MPYAGFWARLAALVIDYVIFILIALLLGTVLSGLAALVSREWVPLAMLLGYVGAILYRPLLESSSRQATLGQSATSIKVTDEQGQRVSFGRALGRFLAHLLSGLTLGFGYAMAVFTSKRQALHDKIAGTLVVKKELTAEEIASAGPAPLRSLAATILAVLAIVLFGPAGIGMMAAIAIPAYQDYTIRAQVIQGLSAAAPFKAAVAEALVNNRPFAELSNSTLNVQQTPSKYVDQVEVVSGAISITYGAGAHRLIANQHLVLVPGRDENQQVIWVCGRQSPPPNITLAVENPAQYTSIPDKYLPIACRLQ
jgi:uncharacterized RDD family membrane protein YckC/Tfp pilus assembly major pilin PilA